MPVNVRAPYPRDAASFHCPAAREAYARPFQRIGIPAVAAAAAQMQRDRLAEDQRRADVRRDVLAILREPDAA